MKLYFCSSRTICCLVIVLLFGFVSTLQAKDVKSAPAPEKYADFQAFHFSRAYSKGFNEDPNLVDTDSRLRWRWPTPQLIFTSRAYNNAIYSYPQPSIDAISEHPVIVYVDQGYGQAIHSYAYNAGKGIIVGWPKAVD